MVGLRRAARAVEAGDARVVACIGGDTFQPERFAELVGRFSSLSIEGSSPYGLAGANLPFALLTRAYMDRYRVGRESFGRLCALQRRHALDFPQALLTKPLTLQEYLDARMVAEPLGLFDCVMPCAGAEGFLVMSEFDARERGLDYVRLKASGERHNDARGQVMPMRFGWEHFREALYSASGFGPESVDVLQLYDDYPVMVFLQLEEMGFVAPGGAAQAIAEEGLSVAGRQVHLNTQGGQLSAGQAGFAGGFMGLTECIRQLSGRALGNQRQGVRRALVSGFGMINYDRGLCTAAATLETVSE
ncbi:thiolase family protein [Kineobactrum salinum]|uniref:thiolase family protein n=1 Tax=Kineobactrum salinum TaxID=2708301 RepID=UPI0018D8FAF5|nr:thiolase family protein [Kineobactrum salinum]